MAEEKLTREQARERQAQIEREAMSGGGFVGLVNCSNGYKVFVAGLSNEETWFTYGMGQASQKEALGKARALVTEHSVLDKNGRPARPQACIGFHVPLASLKAGGENWQQDQYFITPMWQDSFKEVIKPAMEELDIIPGYDEQFWARFTWTPEPGGRTRLNQNDEEVAVLVAYPVAVYENEAAAEEGGLGVVGVSEPGSIAPPDWLAPEIERLQGVVDGMGNAPKPAIAAALAKELGVEDVDEAAKFLGDDVEAKVEMLAKAYGLTPSAVEMVV